MERQIVRALYKNKLAVARKMGYKYGNWNVNIKSVNHMNYGWNKIKQVNKQRKLGYYVGNNVRNKYKDNIEIKDNNEINELITNGFKGLQLVNWMKHYFKL